jgi:hypothetical protein
MGVSVEAAEEAVMNTKSRARAEALVRVQSHQSKPFDVTEGPRLMEIAIEEAFEGEIDGTSTVRALQVVHTNRSSSLASLQRFRGTVGGRRGSFVLRGKGTVEDGRIALDWFVVPHSGTGDLSGLRGEGGFEGEFGKGSKARLDYWFE